MTDQTIKSTIEQTTEMTSESDWQLIQANNLKEVHDQLLEVFENTYHQDFEDEWMGVNHHLKVELRGLKLVDGWVTGFLLTPWMLCSIYIPVLKTPDIIIEDEWLPEVRKNQDYVVIGPLKTFLLGESEQKANLNFDQLIGHYLLQPLVQIMDKYEDNAQAFSAWSDVIKFREAFYAKKQQEVEAKQASQESTKEDGNGEKIASRRSLLTHWQ